jgi:hypothetical protein
MQKRFRNARYLANTKGRQVYFDLLFSDDYKSCYGSTYIVPVRYVTTIDNSTPRLAHDCASYAELDWVINNMIEDLNRLRPRAKMHYADLASNKTYD